MIHFSVESDRVREAARRAPDAVRRAKDRWAPRGMVYTATEMSRQILQRQKTMGRSGFLRKSVRGQLFAGGFSVGPTAAYAEFVDQPTRAHVIEPRMKDALAFPRAGGILTRSTSGKVGTRMLFSGKATTTSAVIVRRVHHPGTRGMFFVDGTRRAVEQPLTAMLDRDVQDELERSGFR